MVSAIITTYKREPAMVLRALDSVLAQTYRDMEIIVVDDSPDDYSEREEVREAIEKRQADSVDIPIRYIAHPENRGACVARNTGLDAAKGEYVAYLDDDDEWLPEKIEKQMNVIQHTNAGLIYCGNMSIDDRTGERKLTKKEYFRGKVFTRLLYSNFIESTSYPLIPKDCLKAIGGFDPLMQAAQDYDVWLRLAERYEIDYVAEPLVLYHEHAGERITTNPKKKISGLERINQKYINYLEKDKKLWWKRHIGIAGYYALDRQGKKAMAIWWKCVCKCPEQIKENVVYFCVISWSIITSSRKTNADVRLHE